MPLYKLAQEMPYDEFLGWIAFFDKRPVGWREDERTLKLMQIQGFKGNAGSVFPSLAQLEKNSKPNEPITTLKNSQMFSRMLSAVGGDSLSFLRE